MRKLLICFVVLLFVKTFVLGQEDKVVYGNDDRKDYYELSPSDPYKTITERSIAALIPRGFFTKKNSTGFYTDLDKGVYSDSHRLGIVYNLCSNQKFYYDPTNASCSGTLIAPDRIITAGHCIDSSSCSTTSFLFGYYVISRDSSGYPSFPGITDDNIYNCRAVKSVLSNGLDYAIVHLDRSVNSQKFSAASISTATQAVTVGTSLTVIGFGSGIPAKIDSGGVVVTSRSTALDYFTANLDTFGGNSGSGVFVSQVQIGVLVRGATDYITSGSCSTVNVLSGCTTADCEEITYAFRGANDVLNCFTNSDCASGYVCDRSCSSTSSDCTGWCIVASGGFTTRGSIDCGQTVTGTTTSSTNVIGNNAPDHLYSFTVSSTGQSQLFDSCGSGYDTWLRVYDSNLVYSFASCDDCGSCSTRTQLSTTLSPGNYILVIEGYQSNSGSYTLTMTCSGGSSGTSSTSTSSVTSTATSTATSTSSKSKTTALTQSNTPTTTPTSSITPTPSITRVTQPSLQPTPTAIVVPEGNTLSCGQSVVGTNVGVSNTISNPSGEVFYSFVSDGEVITFDSCGSSFDTYLLIISNGSIISRCDDCGGCGKSSIITEYLRPGNYIVAIEGYGTENGTFQLQMTCADLTNSNLYKDTITCGSTVTGSNVGAPSLIGESSGDDFYRIEITSSGQSQFIDSCLSSFDTYFRLFDSESNLLNECDDCGSCGTRAQLNETLAPGTYYLVLNGYGYLEGSYVISMTCTGGNDNGGGSGGSGNNNDGGLPSTSYPSVYSDCASVESTSYVTHTYAAMTTFIQSLATAYPSLAQLTSIGKSVQNRDIWMMKIGNLSNTNLKPKVLHVHNMHGDEAIGSHVSLYLMKFLLSNYACNPNVTWLLNSTDIYVVPALNPDGKFLNQRENANGYDLNRDYPDFFSSPADTTTGRQAETVVAMNLLRNYTFSQSLNSHSGSVVCNYPYDSAPATVASGTYYTSPDDALFIQICTKYATLHSSMSQSTEFPGGITNGNEWYKVYGGLQDYSYIYHGVPHVTVELSYSKPSTNAGVQQGYYDNKLALINNIQLVHQASFGTIKTTCGTSSIALSANITFTPVESSIPSRISGSSPKTYSTIKGYRAQQLKKKDLLNTIKNQKNIETLILNSKRREERQKQISEIVGGNTTVSGQYPYAVSLQYRSGSSFYHFCGGSLISPNWILTAAHCYLGSGYTTRAVINVYNIASPGSGAEIIAIKRWVVHPNFDDSTFDNDVALVELNVATTKTTFVTPIFLYDSSVITQLTASGALATVVGWGDTTSGGTSSNTLLQANVPIVSHSVCNNAYGGSILQSAMLCAGLAQGGVDSCQGDSGGPLVSYANKNIQIGIVSWGNGCALPNYYGIYTRLSSYSSFVRQYATDLPQLSTATPTPTSFASTATLTPTPTPTSTTAACTTNCGQAVMPSRSDPGTGYYHRMLLPGTYTVQIQSAGCTTLQQTVVVPDRSLGVYPAQNFVLTCTCANISSSSTSTQTPTKSPTPTRSPTNSISPSRSPTPAIPLALPSCGSGVIPVSFFANALPGLVTGSLCIVN